MQTDQTDTDLVIDLTTPRARRVIKLDAGTYRFRSPYDLTIEETNIVDQLLPEFLELTILGSDRTKKQSEALTAIADRVCKIGLLEGKATDAGPGGRVVLADFFFDLCLRTNQHLAQVRDQMQLRSARGGMSSSPGSVASTPAPPSSPGSRKRR